MAANQLVQARIDGAIKEEAATVLAADLPLESRHRDHALTGNWKDHRDCHIKPDLVADLPEARRRHLALGAPRLSLRT